MMTAETGFGRWIRSRPDLDSKEHGIVCNDNDYWHHKYKTEYGREFQLLMYIEVKTLGKEPSKSQIDTLYLINQIMRNRRTTPTKPNERRQAPGAPLKAFSILAEKEIPIRCFGGYLLQFEQTNPDDSAWIRWGPRRQEITSEQLAALLRFDLDPDTLAPIDLRSHHRPRECPLLDIQEIREV